jgi:hypothetical protein
VRPSRLRATAIAALTAAFLVVVSAPAALSMTTVAVSGDAVTITVHIDCAGCKGATAPDGTDLATYWKTKAEGAWNDAFARYTYCDRYRFALRVKINRQADGFQGTAGDDLLHVASPSGNVLAGVGWEGMREQYPSGNPSQVSPDGTRFYQGDHDGTLPSDATPTVIAHEIGHTMGLGDDRDKNGNAIPGRQGTLMVGGATGVTKDTPLTIDQALVDRIGQQLEKLGKIEKCKRQVWVGPMRVDVTDHDAALGATCAGYWVARLTVVAEARAATGAGSVVEAPVNSCGRSTFARVGSDVPLQVTPVGRGFTIRIPNLGGAGAAADVRGAGPGRAHGTANAQVAYRNGAGQFTYAITIDLTCRSCQRQPT